MPEKEKAPERSLPALGDVITKSPPPARKNLYIKGEDIAIWERAEQLAGESLSQLISDQLRRYVTEREAQAEGFERIVVEAKGPFGPRNKTVIGKSEVVRKVAFYGRWLTEEMKSNAGSKYRVALTKGGKIAVHIVRKVFTPVVERPRTVQRPGTKSSAEAEVKQTEPEIKFSPVPRTSPWAEPELKVYDSLEKADQGGVPRWLLEAAAAGMETEFVYELDI